MSNPFAAQPALLGYLYQIRYALYILVSNRDPNTKVAIELLDDVSFETNQGTTLIQLKHRENAVLTDLNEDIWKSIRIWSEQLAAGTVDHNSKLVLATTASISHDERSLVRMLALPEKFDRSQIVDKLNDLVTKSISTSLEDAFAAYNDLSPSQKLLLAELLHIVHSEPNIVNIVDRIKIELDVRTQHVNPIYETLEGWWFERVIAHLISKSVNPIERNELRNRLNDIRDQYAIDNLPITFASIDPPDDFNTQQRQSNFVKQLEYITPDPVRIKQAIRDYYRAVEQRSHWARHDLLGIKELDIYEKRLLEEWQLRQAQLKDQRPQWADSEAEMQIFGKEMLTWVESGANFPIRMKVTEPYVTRGSYHILANKSEPVVWWHPMFVERLKQLLNISTVPKTLWDRRPVEIANLLNPAFCAVLLRDAVKAYEDASDKKPMPIVLLPLILPVLLQRRIRENLPNKTSTSLHVWIERHPEVLVNFDVVTSDLAIITREALMFASVHRLVDIENATLLKSIPHARTVKFTPHPEANVNEVEAEEIRKRAVFMGRWYAKAGMPSSIYAWWGVRP